MEQTVITQQRHTVGARFSELDGWGLELTTSSREAARAYDRALLSLLAHRSDTLQHVEAALALDPGLVLAHIMRGFALRLLARADVLARAFSALEAAEQALSLRGGTQRERTLCAALRAFCMHDQARAIDELARSMEAQPCCLLSMKLHHALCFMSGRISAMRTASAASLNRVDPGVSGYNFLVGCHAFALEESGQLAEAEQLARSALELCAQDPWTYHVLIHVWTMRDRTRDGLSALRLSKACFRETNNFAAHLSWHHALFAIAQGELDEAITLYDQEVVRPLASDYRDLANCASLLFRIERAGAAVGARWQQLADWAAAREGDHLLAFADLHQLLALLGAGRTEAARAYLCSMRAAALQRIDGAAAVTRSIGLPAAEGLLALYGGDASEALRKLWPLAGQHAQLGGSRAQRELLEMFAVEAALAAHQVEAASELVERLLAPRPQCAWALRYGAALPNARKQQIV